MNYYNDIQAKFNELFDLLSNAEMYFFAIDESLYLISRTELLKDRDFILTEEKNEGVVNYNELVENIGSDDPSEWDYYARETILRRCVYSNKAINIENSAPSFITSIIY